MASQHSRSPFMAMGPNAYTEMWLNVTKSVSTKQPHGGKQHHFSSSTVNKNSNSATNSARQPFTYPTLCRSFAYQGHECPVCPGHHTKSKSKRAGITPKYNTSNNTEKPEKTTKNQTSNNK